MFYSSGASTGQVTSRHFRPPHQVEQTAFSTSCIYPTDYVYEGCRFKSGRFWGCVSFLLGANAV